MARMTKLDFLKEAIEETTSSFRLKCTELTLLCNACAEAAEWRREHDMPHSEKYDAMHEKMHVLGEELDKRIEKRCEQLFEQAKKEKKRGAR